MGQCEHLRILFETMDEGVLYQGAGGTVSLANPAASRILGVSPEELLGRTLEDPRWQTLRDDGSPLAPEERPGPLALRTGRPVRDFTMGIRLSKADEVRWLLVNAVLDDRQDGTGPLGVFATFCDVTDRRRADAARRESEALLRAVTDANPSPIFVKDRESRWTFANAALLRIIGKSREEVLGRTDAEIYADESVGRTLMAVDRRVMESRVQEVVEETVLTPEGQRVFLSIKAPLFDGEGRVVGTVGGARDITERKRAEEALRLRERYLETLLRTALDAIWVISPDGAFIDVNEAACEMVGLKREQVLASCAFDLVDLEARPMAEVAARLMRLGRGGGGERFESRLRHSDGRFVEVDVAAGHLDFEEGRIVCFLRDVTGPRRAAEIVAQNERRFRALIEKSSDAILVLDGQGRIQFWSPSASQLTGWPGEAMLGRHVFEQVHPGDRPQVIEGFARVTAGSGNVSRQLFRYLHQDGSWRSLEACARNLLDDPAVRGVVVNSRDVTEQRAVEEQLRQAQKLESVGRLAGGVAHDFNNQLTVILGCCEALEFDLQQVAPASLEDVRSIQKAGQHARDLTSQLLAFARKQVVAPVELDLNAVVRDGERLLRRLLREDIELRLDLAPESCGLRGDRSQLEQIVFNLVVNARDAMPSGGRLDVETRLAGPCGQRPLAGAARQDGGFVRLIVRDTGAGITPEHRAHLFEPFFTTKELGQGTGLGLATVYGIVDQMGGHLHVETEPGQGTTFVVCLPHHPAAPRPSARPARQQSRGGNETLLLVEDERSVRNMLERALRSAGYRVLLAADGAQGLEVAGRESGPIDLVVCDVVMPGMSGPEMVERLHRERGALRVLHVSGYTDDGLAELQRPGCSVDFLAKPFSIGDLLRRVRMLLDAR